MVRVPKERANINFWYGRRRQVVKAPVCGTGIRGFKSPRLPHIRYLALERQSP